MAWLLDAPERLFKRSWQSANELAQELYTMFKAKGPATHEGSVTIEVPAGSVGLKVTRQQGPEFDLQQPFQLGTPAPTPASGPGPFTRPAFGQDARAGSAPWQTREPGVPGQSPVTANASPFQPLPGASGAVSPISIANPLPPAADNPSVPYRTPVFEADGPSRFTGPPVQFSAAPYVWNPIAQQYTPMSVPQGGPVPGQTRPYPIMGKVVSKNVSENTYNVSLYSNGYVAGPDDDVEEVTIPNVSTDDTLPEGMILTVIVYDDTTFESYPPVWVE